MHAIVVRTSLAMIAAAAPLVVALAPDPAPDPAFDHVPPLPAAAPVAPTLEARALALAHESHPGMQFVVFDTAALGSLRAVFLKGPRTIAVVFRGEDVIQHVLGARDGLERAILTDVVGHPVIAIDTSNEFRGNRWTYREYFLVERDRIEWQLCLNLAGADPGLHTRWTASNWIAAEGTMYFTGNYTTASEHAPSMRGFSFPFDHGWATPEDEPHCLDPRSFE